MEEEGMYYDWKDNATKKSRRAFLYPENNQVEKVRRDITS
jgi:hypothetical protein